jgi:hypothetical protein
MSPAVHDSDSDMHDSDSDIGLDIGSDGLGN